MLLVGAALTPSDAGHGTHRQLGMPACLWAETFERPCLTCGMTTAVTHAAHGSFLASLKTQPLGMLIAVAAAGAFWLGLHGLVTGSRIDLLLGRVLRPAGFWTIGGLAIAAWIYKMVTW
ncbi:MAG: DUF2752 domain-containing protein [Planctomycetota bacterium]